MKHYFALFEPSDDGSFDIRFPQLPGIFSAGDTYEHAMQQAAEAVQFFFEDVPGTAPDPADHRDIMKMDGVAEQLASGSVGVSVPYVALPAKSVRFNTTVDASLLEIIKFDAKRLKVTTKIWMESAFRNQLGI
ncbi:MAG: type II toxin-antitoxin system HicB family antitoxin [Cohaesibacteraceae bacterium]|nr:type II toxin-antitoxin system HicB family antitoxin [Cohaesibacteraceae bacterium]